MGVHVRSDAQIDVPHLVDEVVHLRLVRREEVVTGTDRVVVDPVQRYRLALLVRVHEPSDPVAQIIALLYETGALGRVGRVVVVVIYKFFI